MFPAWPWRDGLAIAMLPAAFASATGDGIAALDRPTGLALVRTTTPVTTAGTIWSAGAIEGPRYLFSAVPARPRFAVAPAYVSSLEPLGSAAWSTEVWKVPVASGLVSGGLVFTAAGEWLGFAADENGERVIVPASAVLNLAGRLSEPHGPPGGDLGIEVQGLSAALAGAVGADNGVIVSWVDPRGAAARMLATGDVIEELNGQGVPSAYAWQVRTTRLAAGDAATLSVRRGGDTHAVTLTVPAAPAVLPGVLGLTLVRERGLGSRVVQVAARTAGERAGVQSGDLVTMVGQQAAPTPAQVRRAFDAVPDGGTLLAAITRGNMHRLVALRR
jgi:S1-C subfamily serine protease